MAVEDGDRRVEEVCELFHDAYEAAAVQAGWETQERSRVPWADVPEENKETMRATVRAVLASDWYAERIAQAEQRGREDNVHHAMCYAVGSKALAERIAQARREGADLGRRATLDPGAFVKRGPDYDGNAYGERLDQRQDRAIGAALQLQEGAQKLGQEKAIRRTAERRLAAVGACMSEGAIRMRVNGEGYVAVSDLAEAMR